MTKATIEPKKYKVAAPKMLDSSGARSAKHEKIILGRYRKSLIVRDQLALSNRIFNAVDDSSTFWLKALAIPLLVRPSEKPRGDKYIFR